MQRTPSSLPVLVVAALALACDGSDGPIEQPSLTISGTYQLRTVNDKPLPYTVQGEGGITFTEGSLVVRPPDSLLVSGSYRYGDMTWTVPEAYTYARASNGSLVARSAEGFEFPLTGDASAVTFVAAPVTSGDPGLRLRYAK